MQCAGIVVDCEAVEASGNQAPAELYMKPNDGVYFPRAPVPGYPYRRYENKHGTHLYALNPPDAMPEEPEEWWVWVLDDSFKVQTLAEIELGQKAFLGKPRRNQVSESLNRPGIETALPVGYDEVVDYTKSPARSEPVANLLPLESKWLDVRTNIERNITLTPLKGKGEANNLLLAKNAEEDARNKKLIAEAKRIVAPVIAAPDHPGMQTALTPFLSTCASSTGFSFPDRPLREATESTNPSCRALSPRLAGASTTGASN